MKTKNRRHENFNSLLTCLAAKVTEHGKNSSKSVNLPTTFDEVSRQGTLNLVRSWHSPRALWILKSWHMEARSERKEHRLTHLRTFFFPPSHHFFFPSSSAYKNQQPSEIFTSIFFLFYYSSLLLQLYSSSTRPSYCHNKFNIPVKKKKRKNETK